MTPAYDGTAQDRETVFKVSLEKAMSRDPVLPFRHAMERAFKSFIILKSELSGRSC